MRTAPSTDYVSRLAQRLTCGVQHLQARFLATEADYAARAQRADGGFAGRQGGSDLYYTSFGLRCAELLGLSDARIREGAARYLARTPQPRDMIECFCRLYIGRLLEERGRPADVTELLQRCRAAGGGYGISPGARPGVYHTFLAGLCCQMLGSELPGGSDAAAFVLSCGCSDGGFADSARDQAAEGGTNPTAAATALLAAGGALDEATAARAARFLASMQRPEGGFGANAAAPAADLLSTFTALVALGELGGLGLVKLAPAARFARALRAPGGGFRGSADDDAADVEYAYYGLGTLGLLSLVAAGGVADA